MLCENTFELGDQLGGIMISDEGVGTWMYHLAGCSGVARILHWRGPSYPFTAGHRIPHAISLEPTDTNHDKY